MAEQQVDVVFLRWGEIIPGAADDGHHGLAAKASSVPTSRATRVILQANERS